MQQERVYGLGKGGSTALDLNVYQGSSDKVKNNSYIGTISIGGLPPDPTIQVHFNVTKEQIIEVSVSVPRQTFRNTPPCNTHNRGIDINEPETHV